MFIHTKAFVLHRSPYNDNYSIVHIYTLERGRLAFLYPNKKSRRKKGAIVLSLLCEMELLLELKPHRDLAFIKEMKVLNPNHAIQLNPIKCSQGIFISELLYRTLTIPEEDVDLYNFLAYSIEHLNHLDRGVANFYLCFTYKLLEYFAVSPLIEDFESGGSQKYFDMQNGIFTSMPTMSDYMLNIEESKHLRLLARMDYRNLRAFKYNRGQRGQILDRLMQYYQLHIPSFRPLQSIAILRNSAH